MWTKWDDFTSKCWCNRQIALCISMRLSRQTTLSESVRKYFLISLSSAISESLWPFSTTREIIGNPLIFPFLNRPIRSWQALTNTSFSSFANASSFSVFTSWHVETHGTFFFEAVFFAAGVFATATSRSISSFLCFAQSVVQRGMLW